MVVKQLGGYADMHVHSSFSHDCTCPMETMILSQLENNASLVAFTEHFDGAYTHKRDYFADVINSHRCIDEMSARFGDKITLLKGVELGETIWNPEQTKKCSELPGLDVVIGSNHVFNIKGKAISYAALDFTKFERAELQKHLSEYFENILRLLDDKMPKIDILAHLTCPWRYIYKFNLQGYEILDHIKLIEEIYRIIIQRNIALEINTSCLGENETRLMPELDYIRLYRCMNGELITLGSDAHTSSRAAYKFDQTARLLSNEGFTTLYYFKDRVAHPYRALERLLRTRTI